ncbi:MAG TPA: aldehyde dehydrogenase family protein [Methanosarcinales archaeon]|nr:aldehyde dehydrogenase family protein [Methanosarcinales archaeon]
MHYKLWIDGKWAEAESEGRFSVINPATGEGFATAASAERADARRAIDAARDAFDNTDWSFNTPLRTRILQKAAEILRNDADSFARLETLDNGMPIGWAKRFVLDTADFFEYFAGLTRPLEEKLDEQSTVFYEPVGVVAGIVPWNLPLKMASWKVAPALAAGNTIVLKPSSQTPLTALKLGEVFHRAGCPDGVLSVIAGPGSVVGAELAGSRKVDKVAFTGGTETGKEVMRLASANLKKITLECGGKSANIVLEDAEIAKAVKGSLFAIFFNSGQVCTAGSRLLLPERIHDRFMEHLIAGVKKLRIGDGLTDPDMGPVISAEQMEKDLKYIRYGIEDGAKLVFGGKRLDMDTGGFFVEPTIFDGVAPEMRIAQEEIFGPVLSVIGYGDEDEAIEIANGTRYGLAGAVWSKDVSHAKRIASRIAAGTVWINMYHGAPRYAPFGGYRESGIGRELGLHGLREYLEVKHLMVG